MVDGTDGLILLGGYALSVGLLALGVWAHGRPTGKLPWRLIAIGAFAGAGVAASATTYYWLSQVWNPIVVGALFAGLPLLLGLSIWWRGFSRKRWMDRLADGGRGAYFEGDGPGRPGFGVLPGSGRARPADDPGAGFESAVHVCTQDIDILGVQYVHLQGHPGEPDEPWRGNLAKLSDLDSTFNLVQVRTPPIATLVIRIRGGVERHQAYGADAGPINPMEDARYRRNTFGAISPGVSMEPVDVGGEFGKWFDVRAADPELAASILTPQVTGTILDDPWFRLGEIVFHHGVVWTTRSGRLTEHALFDNAHKLAQLAAVIPAQAWPDSGFATRVRAAVNSPDGWGADTGRSRMSGPGAILTWINARRAAAARTPLTWLSTFLRLALALALLAMGGYMASNPIFGWYGHPLTSDGLESPIDAYFFPLLGLGLIYGGYRLIRATFWPKRPKPGTTDEGLQSKLLESEEGSR